MSDDLLLRLREALATRYEVEGELDRGGMAVVYLAKDLRHDRKVAIKVLHPSLSATVGTERFLREIDVIARLEHPNILTLIDSGEVEGIPYYVMPYVKGQSLAALLEKEGALPLEQAVRIACEVAEALETAHAQGVVHRDIKPSNVLLSGGHAVVADFGIAAALDESKLARLTRTGLSLGSPIYASPEQASGERELDGRTDIYSLGCMLYEMLGGEAPFEGSLESVVSRKVLGEYTPLKGINPDVPPEIDKAVSKALERDADKRFATAGEMRAALVAGMPVEGPKGWGRNQKLATAIVVLVVVAGAVVAVVQNRVRAEERVRAARLLAQVEDLFMAGKMTEALAVAEQAEAIVPGDTALARLLPQLSFTVPIRTDPPGASVFLQDLSGEGGGWEFLGVTPLDEVRFAGVSWESPDYGVDHGEDHPSRLRFELDGYTTRELFTTAVIGVKWRGIDPMDPVVLEPENPEMEGMIRVPGPTVNSVQYADFFIDRYEVTNRQFKEFVDAGGYQNPEYWVHPFVLDGRELTFEEAMTRFRDQTGRPGPSTWRVGSYPEGQADYPVGGVSWYEAAAYARFVGKELPTTAHWVRGRRYYRENSYVIAPRSNLASDGPRPVGQNEAMTTLGLYDLVGNVREWCFNEVGEGERATRGGGWPDAPFHVGWIIPKPAFDRDPTHGFRLVRLSDDPELLETARAPVARTGWRDYSVEEPVSDAEFEVFRRFYAYDSYSLNPVVEQVDTFEHWTRETVSFDLPYGERGGVFLYMPRDPEPPLQTVLFWGGSGILNIHSIDEEWTAEFDYMVLEGRAVAVPLFRGSYGRDVPLSPGTNFPGPYPSATYRDATIQWVKDLSATIDYLETRQDLDAEKVGFYGYSFGARIGPIPLAVEPRISAAVFNTAGLRRNQYFPEADPFNYVTRVQTPVLMLNGEFDIVFPYEPSQLPLFQWLGSEEKEHFVFPAAHIVPKDEVIGRTLAWYDKYLGPVGGG